MIASRLVRSLLCPIFLVVVIPACQSLHHYRPVVVQVRDIESKQPIPGAEVKLWYPLAESRLAPYESSDTAGDDGIARLRAAPYGDAGVVMQVTARGYQLGELSLSTRELEAIESLQPSEAASRRPVSHFVELYAEPGPSIELVLPPGYRGMVRAAVQIDEGAACPSGQRVFSCEVPDTGVVTVTGPPLLRRVSTPDFRAKYADGTVLGRQPANGGVGFWWVRDEGRYHCFLAGTAGDYNIYRGAQRARELGLDKSRGSGNEKGHGRHRPDGDDNLP